MKPSRGLILLRLLAFMRPFVGWVALSVLLGVATVAAGIGLLGTSAHLIASAALHPSVAALQVAIVGVRFFGISRAVFRYLERLVSHSVNFRLLAGLRVWFYRALEPLAPARLQDHRSADLLSRAIADVETLENFYVRAVAPPIVALVVTVGVGWFVGRYDPRLALVLVLALLVNGIGMPLLAYGLGRRPGEQVIAQRARLHASTLDAIQGMPDLLAFGQGQAQLERIAADAEALDGAQFRLARAGALVNAAGLLVTGLALCGVLVIAIPLVSESGGGQDGVALAVLSLVTMASFEAVNPLTQAAQHLESSLQAARRLFALVMEPERPVEVGAAAVATAADIAGAEVATQTVEQKAWQPDAPGTGAAVPDVVEPGMAAASTAAPGRLEPPAGGVDLRIRGLTFAYPGRPQPALVGLDLDLPPGKKVALVGESGAGKSTLFNLLLRFWEAEPGAIRWNGRDLAEYDPAALRRRMALVEPSAYLFAGTLRQNLLLAQPQASAEALERAIRLAQLEPWIASLPEGLDTWIGERGTQISGGERQRVAVARAVLQDAPLLLLDEPAANLDAENERRLLGAFRQAAEGRSVIYITHRLLGLEEMDEILFLREGRVVERGTHTELLALGGSYAGAWKIQTERMG